MVHAGGVQDAWPEISAVVAAAPYRVQVLPVDAGRAERCRTALGLTTQSWLGALVTHTGGLLVDQGWLRVLGGGHAGLPDVAEAADPAAQLLTVAYDVLGGRFAWTQARPDAPPTVHYFGPDVLAWEDLGQGYADWLYAMLAGSVTEFYASLRWPGWAEEVAALSPGEGLHTSPPPSTVEGADLSRAARRPVPLTGLVAHHGGRG
ncbi:hypothetical protein Sya03_37570 [Spirilliplanes yamanashiensis]|uniref:DUF2625 domain-containing protein n=1 Tax=Spirilliplanes yamanashiensis TaxID=42233 RepID=A0A8J3YAW3_9ACTN|nr:hypothetical protein Sya03_37570 [Spirilliplanes yamanashiensis]